MTDRGAAERACKDPNPIIDGRKANVNLAYLGAKPRSIQTGEARPGGGAWRWGWEGLPRLRTFRRSLVEIHTVSFKIIVGIEEPGSWPSAGQTVWLQRLLKLDRGVRAGAGGWSDPPHMKKNI